MNTFKFEKSRFLLTLIFIVATALIFFLMGITYKHLQKLSENNYMVNHSMDITLKLEKLYANLKDIETERRNFLLSKDPNSRSYIKKRITEINAFTNELGKMVGDNPEQVKNLESLKMMIAYKYKIVNESFNEKISEEDPEILKKSLLSGRSVMASISDKIYEMQGIENTLLEKRRSEFLFAEKSTPIYLYIISLFSLGLIGFAFYKINKDFFAQREINRNLQIALDSANLSEMVGKYGVWTLDLKSGTYSFSDNEYRILGYEPQAFPANYENFIKHIHPEDLEYVNKKTTEMLNTKEIAPFMYRAIRKDGQERIFQTSGKKLKDKAGNDVVLGITSDITEKIADKESINSMNKEILFYNESSKIAESIGNYGFWKWDVKNDAFEFSDNIFKIFGINPNNFTKNIESFIPTVYPEDKDLVNSVLENFYRGENDIKPYSHRIIRQDNGEVRHIRVSNKLMNAGTDEEYYLMITQDITDEIFDKQAIQEKNRILEANNKELMAFNYVASHDLQEPLRKIETFISRLKDKDYEKLSENGKQYLDRTQASAGRMRNLINDLLQFSRTTRAEQVFEYSDLNTLMENAIEDLHQNIEEKSAIISYEKMPSLKVIPFQIQQLFNNIIGNSLKYSQEKTIPKINIKVEKISAKDEPLLHRDSSEKYYRFSFKDNGIGFEPEYSEKIFELFNRLHGKMDYEGTGIGLAICKKIVENHKGYIFAEGKPNEGALFTIFLPEKI